MGESMLDVAPGGGGGGGADEPEGSGAKPDEFFGAGGMLVLRTGGGGIVRPLLSVVAPGRLRDVLGKPSSPRLENVAGGGGAPAPGIRSSGRRLSCDRGRVPVGANR